VLEETFDGDSLVSLRHGVGAHGSALGLSDDQADDLMLIVQEIASNAVRHGPGHGTVRLWRAGNHIHCQVANPGAAPADLAEAGKRPRSPGEIGGRGIWLARLFSDSLSIDTTDDTTTITATINLASPPTATEPSNFDRC
jgi:anti-sigma regulatory factor (Ser/Thr protein kinase)